jgi:hypothetical protein
MGAMYRFDTSTGRGPLKTEIGVGKVIKGMELPPHFFLFSRWEEGVRAD